MDFEGSSTEVRRPWFKVYEEELLAISQLSGARQALAVLGLLRFADAETREAHPSCETIGRLIGIAPNHVSAALRAAVEAGVIEPVGKVRRTVRYRISSRWRDQSQERDQSRARESIPPADGSKFLPSTGDRTDQKQNSEQIPPNPPPGGRPLADAESPTLFPVAPAEDRPELGATPRSTRPRLSPELHRYAETVARFACDQVNGRYSASQAGKLREVMKAWVGGPLEGHLHDSRFWSEVFRVARDWWSPKKSGICTAMATEAARQLQTKLEQQAQADARIAAEQEHEREQALLRERQELERRAREGDQDAIDKLWGRDGEVQSAS